MALTGKCIATFNNRIPIAMHGGWSNEITNPVFRSWGQTGYNGSAIGTRVQTSGNYQFVVEPSGANARQIIQECMYALFTLDFPLGDPAAGASGVTVIDCHFDSLKFEANNPDGSFIISGTMSGAVPQGEAFQPPPA